MSFIWPFTTKSPAQYQRIDQGWDLQGLGPGEEQVLAIASGTVTYAHDPGTGGAHFGDPYPILHLDAPVDGIPIIYYGHTHPTVPEGTHVNQGDQLATTSSPGGGGAPNHWLEIGPWINGPTGNGQWMHDQLISAPIFQEDDVTQADIDAIVNAVNAHTDARTGDIYNTTVSRPDGEVDLRKLRADLDAIKAHLGIA